MRIFIVGNGGREHALLWKLARDDPAAQLFATRPNGGMAALAEAVEIAPTDVEALAGWAAARRMDLTVVGPEVPLAGGIVDRFGKAGLPVFGPTRAAARIETSKAYSKDLMTRAGVPTAAYETFSALDEAEAYIRASRAPIVVKASGLAAGKGAVVCETVDDALAAVRAMMGDLAFGEAGREVVIEEFMTGEELSVFGVTDGEHVLTLLPSQDHKRIGEGERGPNTGGMGAYAPVSIASDALMEQIERQVFLPTLAALAEADAPFRGLLYAGLMITDEGPRVVEFNCRFGDPETQAVLPMMESSLLELMDAVANGEKISGRRVVWREGAAVTTVLASAGYPGAYEKGREIGIPDYMTQGDDVIVFHAGTTVDAGTLRTNGGRVLAVTGTGPTMTEASERSREAASRIEFEGRYFRDDIGWRELER